jgi:hypothetical protein
MWMYETRNETAQIDPPAGHVGRPYGASHSLGPLLRAVPWWSLEAGGVSVLWQSPGQLAKVLGQAHGLSHDGSRADLWHRLLCLRW